MIKEIQKWIQGLSGNIIGIGIEKEEILDSIMKNDKILECNLLESLSLEEESNKGRKKYLPIKKMRKKFGKKNTDFMLMNYEVIAPYLKYVVKDSIYLIKKEIMIYHVDEDAISLLQKRYQRYDTKIKKKKVGKDVVLSIHVENAKNSFWKDFLYRISDTIYNLIELISNFLIH